MSLITQCPACATYFRVVPDQLRISDGWVRCGQCDEVFDANASVRNEDALVPVEAPAAEVPQAVDISATAHAELAAQMSQPAPWPEPVPQAVEEAEPEPVEEEEAQPDPFLDRSPRELSDFSTALVGADLEEAAAQAVVPEESTERRYMQAMAHAHEEDDPKLSFMKPLKKPSRWTRPWVRASLAVLSLLLVVGLVGQVVLHERDRLAAQYPEYRGELSALAQAVGLEVRPLKQIEAVVIDSSAFTKVRNEVYKLSFTLRNNAPIALATPSMELTLTDMQDQVLLRRVLTPADFAKLPEVLAAGAEQSAALSVAVRAPLAQDKVAGYRLLAFYP